MTSWSILRVRVAGRGRGVAARLVSKMATSASSIRNRGRLFGLVAALIACNWPDRIHPRTFSAQIPQRRASSGGVIFVFATCALRIDMPLLLFDSMELETDTFNVEVIEDPHVTSSAGKPDTAGSDYVFDAMDRDVKPAGDFSHRRDCWY